nr:protein TPR1-like isoform X14 [Ipomoea batatas]
MVGHSAESPINICDDESEPSKYGDSGEEGESIDGDEDVEYQSDAGHRSGASMAKHRAEMQSNEGRGIRVKRSGVKTCVGSPPTKKRTRKEGGDEEMGESFDGDQDGEEYAAN